jgi:ectoine hydroxylase-related dioxygenase (phytanoyl-CoA dioxygenase family)
MIDIVRRMIDERGWAVTDPVIDADEVERLRQAVAPHVVDGRGGARNLLEHAFVRDLAKQTAIRGVAARVLGDGCFAVRALLFDKTPQANWKVVWHQDLTIATQVRAEVPGYGPWTEKAGVPHVQPPVPVLEQMLAVRIHLDPCRADNGPVRVIDGSHRVGRLSPDTIDDLRQSRPVVDCVAEQGAILAFRPLILHASAPSQSPNHRRVIHVEYAACELAPPLEWHSRVA